MAFNTTDMASYDNDFQRMVQEKIEADARKQAERTARYRASYADRTCIPTVDRSPYTPTQEKKPVSMNEYQIEQLKTENQKLLEENKTAVSKYNDLLGKTTRIVEAYKKIESELETLKAKKAKKEAASEAFAGLGKVVRKGYDKIILWFKT